MDGWQEGGVEEGYHRKKRKDGMCGMGRRHGIGGAGWTDEFGAAPSRKVGPLPNPIQA